MINREEINKTEIERIIKKRKDIADLELQSETFHVEILKLIENQGFKIILSEDKCPQIQLVFRTDTSSRLLAHVKPFINTDGEEIIRYLSPEYIQNDDNNSWHRLDRVSLIRRLETDYTALQRKYFMGKKTHELEKILKETS